MRWLVAMLCFDSSVQIVIAWFVLPVRRFTDLINTDDSVLDNFGVVRDATLADVPTSL